MNCPHNEATCPRSGYCLGCMAAPPTPADVRAAAARFDELERDEVHRIDLAIPCPSCGAARGHECNRSPDVCFGRRLQWLAWATRPELLEKRMQPFRPTRVR